MARTPALLLLPVDTSLYRELSITFNFAGVLEMQNFYCYESDIFASFHKLDYLSSSQEKSNKVNENQQHNVSWLIVVTQFSVFNFPQLK